MKLRDALCATAEDASGRCLAIFPKVLFIMHSVSLAGDRISEGTVYRVNTSTDK
jgi:hypothetical protein